METEGVERIANYVDSDNYERVCNYLVSCASYLPEPEDAVLFKLAFGVFQKFGALSRQMGVALRLRDENLVKELFESQLDPAVKRQLGYMLAREQLFIYEEEVCFFFLKQVGFL